MTTLEIRIIAPDDAELVAALAHIQALITANGVAGQYTTGRGPLTRGVCCHNSIPNASHAEYKQANAWMLNAGCRPGPF